jgi:hypothetical protein
VSDFAPFLVISGMWLVKMASRKLRCFLFKIDH